MKAKLSSKAKLTQIESSHSIIPKGTMPGTLVGLPLIDQSFVFEIDDDAIAKSIGGKYLTTSSVISIVSESRRKILFKTLNSTYQLEILDETKDN